MSEISAESAVGVRGPARRWSRRALVGAAACVAMLGAAPVVANELGVFRNENGVVVNEDALQVEYQGRRYTRAEMADLHKQGRGLVTVNDVESAEQGVVHAFDTEAEAEAWYTANR